MRYVVVSLGLLWVAAGAGVAQGLALPGVQPKQFSHLAGKFFMRMEAAPTEVFVEQPITVRVTIVANGAVTLAPRREKLRIFPESLADEFHVEQPADQDKALVEKGLWEFVYRMRPKSDHVKEIPGPELVYYNPQTRKFQTTIADSIAIRVKAARPPSAAELKLKVVPAPPGFLEVVPLEEVLRERPSWPAPPWPVLAMAVAAPPVCCLAGFWLWRRHPSLSERRQWARSRTARQTLRYLETGGTDAPRMAAALTHYLRQRLDLAAADPTPAEVAAHLRRQGANKQVCAGWREVYETLAGMQYGPAVNAPVAVAAPTSIAALRRRAAELIHALEVEPCVRR